MLAARGAQEHNARMWLTRLALGAAAVAVVFALYAARKKSVLVSSAAEPAPANITVGTQVTDNGPYAVVNVNISKARDGFLNIGGAYPNQTLTIFVAEADMAKFDIEAYAGKRILVRGIIAVSNGKPQIKVTDPSQIRIVP